MKNKRNYKIEHKVKTLLESSLLKDDKPTAFEKEGIRFEHWNFSFTEGYTGNSWLCTASIDAFGWKDAFSEFHNKMRVIIPRLALIGQCYIEYLNQPYLISLGSVGIFNYAVESNPVPLGIDTKTIKALDLLLEYDRIPDRFYYYWKEATNCTGYSSKLLLMFAALDSLGRDKRHLKRQEILGDELANELYESNEKGLRHRLTHGDYYHETDFKKNYVVLLHKTIVNYFNNQIFKEELIRNVVNPQRNFSGITKGGIWLIKNKKDENLDFKNVFEDFDENGYMNPKNHEYIFDEKLWKEF